MAPAHKWEGEDRRAPRSAIEQHVGTILQIIVVALLGWSLKTTQELSNDVSVLKVQVAALQTLVTQGTADRYRAADADRDHNRIYSDIRAIDGRVSRLEDKR